MARPLHARRRFAAPIAQRGWIGLLALLVALAIVGWLAISALRGYGVTGRSPAAEDGAKRSGATAADPVERARATEAVIVERAREAARRADGAAEGQ